MPKPTELWQRPPARHDICIHMLISHLRDHVTKQHGGHLAGHSFSLDYCEGCNIATFVAFAAKRATPVVVMAASTAPDVSDPSGLRQRGGK